MGSELNVDAILTGRVTQRGDLLEIATELVDTHSGWRLWGQPYVRGINDLMTVPEDITREISEKLRISLTRDEKRRLSKSDTRNPNAYVLYLKGRHHWNNGTEDALRKSIPCYEQAIKDDSSFALAYACLADSYSMLGFYGILSPGVSFGGAEHAAQRALEIDATLADAHASLGFVAFHYTWHRPEAEEAFKRAIKLNSRTAKFRFWYAWYLAANERFSEATAQIQEAKRLEPVSVFAISYAGFVFYLAREYDRAFACFREALEVQPDFAPARWWLGLSYIETDQYEEAIGELQKSITYSRGHPSPTAALGHLYGRLGWLADEQAIFQALTELSGKRFLERGMCPHWILQSAGLVDQTKIWRSNGWKKRARSGQACSCMQESCLCWITSGRSPACKRCCAESGTNA